MAASLTRAHGSGWMCHARLQMALGTGRFRASSQFGSGHWAACSTSPFKTGCPSARSSSAVTAITEAARICLTPLIWVHRPGYYSTQDIFFASRRRIARALGLFNSSPPRRSYTSITAREIPHSRAMLIANFHFSFTERQTGLSTSGSVLRASVPPPQSFPCSIS